MELLLLALALAIMIFAGAGASLILHPRANLIELMALSFLFGTTFVSMASFAIGFLYAGAGLRWMVTGLCVAVGLWGLRRRRAVQDRDDGVDWRWFILGTIQTGFVSLLAYRRDLGWDGLLIFEIKARLAFLNGGVVPAGYFSDPFRGWSHPSYPLLLPLTEGWIYLWLGRADQQLVKILFPMFFASALAMLYTANRRKGRSLLYSPLLLMTVPLIWLGNGSASSGYADFPLAVFYLAAVVYFLEYQRTGDPFRLRLVGFLLAAGCWTKREGMILWLCLLVIAAINVIKNRERTGTSEKGRWEVRWLEWRQLLFVALPSLAVIVVWRAILHARNLQGIDDFLLGYDLLQNNISRVPVIVRATFDEIVGWRHWGALWPISTATAIWMVVKQERLALPLAVFLPIVFYCGIYLFSAWSDYVLHIESSFPRLMIQVSLIAVMMITSLGGRKFDRGDTAV